MKKPAHIITAIAIVFCLAGVMQVHAEEPAVVGSADGTPISYEAYGEGEPTLLFVHGWSCDSRYWREQIPFFTNDYRIILMDLAGHGRSGTSRQQYSMKSFGEDVKAVAEATGSDEVILVGHSMGGIVIAEAARLMPDRVTGLIGIDTLMNVEYPMTREQLDGMVAPLEEDFPAGCRQFAASMILPDTDAGLREWILSDMADAPPAVAVSAMEEMLSLYLTGEAARLFEDLPIPVVTVNGDMWPVDVEANRRHMHSFDAIVLENADHFLMMAQPNKFNPALETAIRMIQESRTGSKETEAQVAPEAPPADTRPPNYAERREQRKQSLRKPADSSGDEQLDTKLEAYQMELIRKGLSPDKPPTADP